MQNEPDIYILNRPRSKKRGLTLSKSGRIYLRSVVIKLLGLKKGDKIIFFCIGSQMYIAKSVCHPDAIHLYGRKSQLRGCSVSTIRCLFLHIPGIPPDAQEVDLVVSDHLETITVGNDSLRALAVVNRTDATHCRFNT